ncbi:MAG: hypothetical protein ABR549_04360, partial [Mycobacteriales bacterium]
MWPFRRRKAGKHALGAAVTAIPVFAPPSRLAQSVEPVAPTPHVLVSDAPRASRVELGFRDGTSAALAPGS